MIPESDQRRIARTLFALQILYLIAVALSRVSTALLISRLTRWHHHRIATHILSIVATAWGVAAILIISLRCNLSQPWDISGGSFCISPYPRWLGVEIVSMLLEIGSFSLAIFLVWGLQLATSLKLMVIAAFLCRPLVIVPLAFRILYLSPRYFTSDPFYNGALATVLTQVSMHYAIIAATLPVAKPFIRAFHSGYMDPEGYTGPHPSAAPKTASASSARRRAAYPMHFMPASAASARASAPSATSSPVAPPSVEPFPASTLSRPASAGKPAADLPYAGEGTVETRIEHDPTAVPASYELAYPATRRPPKPRRGKSRDRTSDALAEELVIQQTRDYEVTYEPA